MITVIIPAREEVYLQRTIENVLENAEGEIEIIAICDGYWPNPPVKDHKYVRVIHNTEPRGQRMVINDAAKIAQGDYIMKLDAHCAVGPSFNKILEDQIEYNWTVIPEMWNLDPETWKPKHFGDYRTAVKMGKVNPYMFMAMVDGHLRAQYYSGIKRRQMFIDKKDIMIDETMCCMGPSFFMHRDRFWELGGCDENHGHWGQQGVEVACKAWLSGGKLMVNKNTWFAHWFRGSHVHESGRRGFPYKMSQRQIDQARAYSDDLWLNDKWPLMAKGRNFKWLLDKFDPPKWEKFNKEYRTERQRQELLIPFYRHIHRRKNDSTYKGISLLKLPNDLQLYHEVLWDTRPEIIIEIGTKFGASALFFADQLELIGRKGEVITIDVKDQVKEKDPRIDYWIGDSLDDEIIKRVHDVTKNKRTMLVIDGNHDRVHVKNELHKYHDIVTPGQYMVVEDCYIDRGLFGPGEARDWFLSVNKNFEQTNRCMKYLVGITLGGWLRRK